MSKLNDDASGVVPGTPDESENSEISTNGGTAVDAVEARKQQVRHRVQKLDELEAERRANKVDAVPDRILTDPQRH